ncbi:MAG: hypothetical protein WC050_00950 [Candidatus Paceibacterota bacterium]
MQEAALYLGTPVVFAVGVLLVWFGIRRTSFSSFFIADRTIGLFAASVSLAVCWIWVFALIVGPQQAYLGGIGPLAWFVGANTAAIVVFALFFFRLRTEFTGQWSTFTEFIRFRFGAGMLGVYTIGISGMMTYAVWAQLTGALALLAYATGADKSSLMALIAFLTLVVAMPRGVQSVFSADMVKALMIGAVLGIAVVVFGHADGVHGLWAGSRGFSGTGPAFLSWPLLRDFGIPVTISLLSGIVIDQQMWQRSLSLRSAAARFAPWIAAAVFFILIASVGALGLAASYLHISVADPQLAGFAVVESILPAGAKVFAFMIAAALLATGASALNAVSSAWAVDALRWWKPASDERTMIRASRIVMVVILLISVFIALAGVTLAQMLLLIGTFRGALFFPTILALFTRGGEASRSFTVSILVTMVVGPIIAYYTSVFTAGMIVLSVTALLCGVEWLRARRTVVAHI